MNDFTDEKCNSDEMRNNIEITENIFPEMMVPYNLLCLQKQREMGEIRSEVFAIPSFSISLEANILTMLEK